MQTMVSTAGGALQQQVAPPEPDELQPGAKAGPWVVERELGRGGMGSVYAVTHEDIGKRAALKVMHRRLVSTTSAERVLLEARVVNQVGHPNIVDIFETGTLPDGRPYIVMERLEGVPLSYRADDGKILPDLVIGILLQVCDALIAAHAANIVHRDLKLDNVFLLDNADDPGQPRVKLLDWGIAKIITTDVRHTIEGQLVGTPQYLSPEQARGASVTPQTDVYSLGVMAYELFLEQLPFEAETSAEIMAMHLRCPPPPPSELWPDMPASLENLLLAMLAKDPEARPSMLTVAHTLEQIRDELEQRKHATELADERPFSRPATVRPESRRSNRILAPGLAPTERADDWVGASPRRWHLALGGLALAVSALLFVITRDADRAVASTAAAVTPPPVLQAPALSASVEPAEVPTPLEAPTEIESPPPTPVTEPPHKPAKRPTARRYQAKPRLDTPIDPDGTLDPYQ